MGIYRRLFKPKENHLQKQAATLVSCANINAISNEFPSLREVDAKHFDFVLTVAGVFIASSRLNSLKLNNVREEILMEIVAESLIEWDASGIGGFEDCKNLFEKEYDRLTVAKHEPRFIASDAVGKWIVWNVLQRTPETQDECKLIRYSGAMITHAFFDWWKE